MYAIFPSGLGFPFMDLEAMRTRCANGSLADCLGLDAPARPIMVFNNELCLDLSMANSVDFSIAANRLRRAESIYVVKSEYAVFMLRLITDGTPVYTIKNAIAPIPAPQGEEDTMEESAVDEGAAPIMDTLELFRVSPNITWGERWQNVISFFKIGPWSAHIGVTAFRRAAALGASTVSHGAGSSAKANLRRTHAKFYLSMTDFMAFLSLLGKDIYHELEQISPNDIHAVRLPIAGHVHTLLGGRVIAASVNKAVLGKRQSDKSTSTRRLLALSAMEKAPLETLTYDFATGTIDISLALAEYATNGTGLAFGSKHTPPLKELGTLQPGNKWYFSLVKEVWEQGVSGAPSDTQAEVTDAIDKLERPLERRLLDMV